MSGKPPLGAVTAAVWGGPESSQFTIRQALRVRNMTKVAQRVSPGWDINQVTFHWPPTDSFILCEASMGMARNVPLLIHIMSLSPYDTRQLHTS